jgi:plasmid replication initiation protein
MSKKCRRKFDMIAAKPNIMIGSKDGFESIYEYRILLGMLFRVYMGVDITKPFSLDVKYILGGETDGGNNYKSLKSACRTIVRRYINLMPEDAYGFMFRNVVASVDYEPLDRTGKIVVQFNPQITPQILNMFDKKSDGYTKIFLRYSMPIRSLYSSRLYEFLLSNKYRGKIIVPLNELRTFLGVPKKAYPNWYDFNKNVLMPAVIHMKKYTNLSFKYSGIRTGRKFENIEFLISDNVPEYNWLPELEYVDDDTFMEEYEESMAHIAIVREHIWEKSQKEILDSCSKEKIKYYHSKFHNLVSSGKNIINQKSYFYTLLKTDEDDYKAVEEKEKMDLEQKKKDLEAKKKRMEEIEKSHQKYDSSLALTLKCWTQLSFEDQHKYMNSEEIKEFVKGPQRQETAAALFIRDNQDLFEDEPDEQSFIERYRCCVCDGV